jgi:hypothetical protein
MTRNTHDRVLDHHNPDETTNVILGSGTTSYADGASLQDVISSLDSRITTTVVTSAPSTSIGVVALNLLIGNGSGVIPTGIVYDVGFEQDFTISKWTLLADQSGSLVIDLWKDTYANFAPTVADTITASAKPTLSSQSKNTSSTLTGWTTSIKAGDIIRVNVDSSATVTRATLVIKLQKVASSAVAPSLIGPATSVFAPVFKMKVSVALISSGTTVYSFALARVAPPRIGPATTLFSPTLIGEGIVSPPKIGPSTNIYSFTLGRVALPLIGPNTIVRQPTVTQ